METLWKVLSSLVVLFFLGLCNGLPINLENSGPDPHTQFLTGLVAVLLTICSVVLLAGCLCCQRQNGFKEFRDSPVASSATIISSNLDHGHVNPIANSSSEFTIFTPISPPHHNNNVFLANQRIVSCNQEDYKDGDIDASLWFDGSEKDFPRTKLKYIRELGKGWFGRVVEGTAQNISDDPSDPEWTPVVVRILEASATSREKLLFLNDATIYKCGYHPNILRILGRSLDTVPLLLLQEYSPQGDLKKYLRMCKSSQDKLVAEDMPLRWCYQLTLAIKFLHDQKLTHPDLAARNCLLSEDLSLKLGDYGLSASYFPEDYYQGSPGVPLRWCAPEIISYTSTTIQTTASTAEANVWALGITMWEILEWGEQPYVGLTDDEVISQVLGTSKVRLPRPTYHLIYTDYMYKIMQSCWYNSESRVTVSQIDLMMADLMHVYEHTKISLELSSDFSSGGEPVSLQDFDSRWNALKPNSPLPEDSILKQLQPMNHPNQDRAQKSASLNNLHGSLDNLLDTRQFDPMESWLENVASDTSDLSFVRGLSEAINDLDNAIAMENMSSSPEFGKSKLRVGGQITSSESETEDENWRKKIERGAYTEKVRQKSRSVADLMVLTHIDYSESDSETLPSLDFKVNQKVRYLKNVDKLDNQKRFGSEGNLLHVNDNTFQEELKKLQEERRDSLLFVPDKFSECSFSAEGVVATTSVVTPTSISNNRVDALENSPVKQLMEKLNSPSEMVPPQRVYNVFNVRVQHSMNVGGAVCDKMSENVGQIYHDANTGGILEKESLSEDICDKQLESKVFDQNAIINQNKSSENQINPFSDYGSDKNVEESESTNHIKTIFNRPVSEPFSASNNFYCKYVNDKNTVLSVNYDTNGITNKTSETYPFKKDDNNVHNDICKINGANEEIKVNYQKMSIENQINDSKLNKSEKVTEISDSQIMLNNNSRGISGNKFSSSNESLTRTDSPKENNFDIKIEILNEHNSTLNQNMQKNHDINTSKKLNNELSSKENFATSNENSKNVKLKVPKLSEMIQRNAIDYKVHHHGCTKDKTSVGSKTEENDKSVHQELVDKDSGLNTPENSASLEKLYDDNEEMLDVGSFDSDRSNEACNKGNLMNEMSNEEYHVRKENTEELSVISYFENQKAYDRETEISNLIDFCASKENRLICDLFLINEKTNYFEDSAEGKSDQKQTVNNYNTEDNEIQPIVCTNTDMFSKHINATNAIKEYQFLNSAYETNIQTFLQSEICHSSNLMIDPSLLNRLNEATQKLNIVELSSDTLQGINEKHNKFEILLCTNHLVDKTDTIQKLVSDASTKEICLNTLHYTNLRDIPEANLKNEAISMEKDQKTLTVDDFFINNVETNVTFMDKSVKQENSELCDKPEDSLYVTDAKTRNTYTKSFKKTDLLAENESILNINNYNESDSIVKEHLSNQNEFKASTGNINACKDNLPNFSSAQKECDNTHINQNYLLVIEDDIPSNEICNKISEKANMREDIANNITSIIQNAIKIIGDNNLTILETGIKNAAVECTNLPAGIIVENSDKLRESELDSFVSSDIIDNSKVYTITSQTCNIVPKDLYFANYNKNILTSNISEDNSLNSDKITCSSDILNKTKAFLHNEIENCKEHLKKHSDTHIVQKDITYITHFNEDLIKTHSKHEVFEDVGETLPLIEEITNENDKTEEILDFAQNIGSANNLKHTFLGVTETSLCDYSYKENLTETNHENKALENKILKDANNASPPQSENVINKNLIKKSETLNKKCSEDVHVENNIDQSNKTGEILHDIEDIADNTNKLIQPQHSDVDNILLHNNQLLTVVENEIDSSSDTRDLNADSLKYTQGINYDILLRDHQNLEKVKGKPGTAHTNDLLSTISDIYLNTNPEDAAINETFTLLRNEIENDIYSLPIILQNTPEIDGIHNICLPQDDMDLINNCPVLPEIENSAVKCSVIARGNETSNNIKDDTNKYEKLFCDILNPNLMEIEQTPKECPVIGDVQSAKFSQENIGEAHNYTSSKSCSDIKETANLLCHEIENDEQNIFIVQDFNTKQKHLSSNIEAALPEELAEISNEFSKFCAEEVGNKNDIQDVHVDQNLLDVENRTKEDNFNDTTNSVLKSINNEKNNDTEQTSIFLKTEIENYIGTERRVDFDLSDTQDKMSLNSLTHLSAFTSTPYANRRPNESNTVILGASDDYSIDYYSGLKTSVDPENNSDLEFSSNFVRQNNSNDLYSLETWDNFLGKSFDEQENTAMDFSDFSQEPHSLLFLECDADNCGQDKELKMTKVLNETYDAGLVATTDGTFIKDQISEAANLTVEINREQIDDKIDTDLWKNITTGTNSGGWFLHPQCASKEATGSVEKNRDTAVPSTSDESYVRFSMDDEIMAAIRNELLTKLPHAQRASSDHQVEENCEEMDSAERNEVFLRYNVYNTPLSPIPEESWDSEFGSGQITPKRINDTSDDEGDSSDWSVQEDNNSSNTHTEEIISPRIPDSPARCRTDHCRHTPSQDSCCSNDTLFNIEDLNGGINDRALVDVALHLPMPLENVLDSMEDETSDSKYDDCNAEAYVVDNERTIQNDINQEKEENHIAIPIIKTDHNYILEFLDNERYNEMNLHFDAEEISSASDIYLTVSDNTFSFGQNVAPLNSPEDRPWKELQASFRNCDEDQLPKMSSNTEDEAQIFANESASSLASPVLDNGNFSKVINKDKEVEDSNTLCRTSFVHHLGEGEETDDCFISDEDIDQVLREELESEVNEQASDQIPEEVGNGNNSSACNDEQIYVNLTKTKSGESFNTEHSSCYSPKNNDDTMEVEYENLKSNTCDEGNIDDGVEEVDDSDDKFSRFEDLFGPLTDIRFSGPGSSSQLMTTSFSESNDLGDDQDWDSGSDTRSSSSGEFIWKNADYVTQMENIQEEEVSAESSKDNSCASSTSTSSEGEDECPEFVPSAWDKYATPTKSALRSPEKTLKRNKEGKVQDQHIQKEKKSKGVWFKKQKYHCVYEYPREPESPILQSYDLWKPTPDYATLSDWDLDANTYLPTALTEPESSYEIQSKHENLPTNLYHLSTFSDNIDPTSLDEDFFVSSSSKPFDMLTGLTSQFFPGRQFPGETWTDNINITPDSGVEDVTIPGNFTNSAVSPFSDKDGTNSEVTEVQSLKVLATNAAEGSGRRRELGGLRHTRNKLKLDLPPSPSAFTSNRTFSVESVADEIVSRQVPTFTTFGKSRFLVQHVDTPPDSGRADKNVSFEALPHKKPEPYFVEANDWKHQKKDKHKIESVRGEASLLDSTDEDSGIESCTLDRKRFNV